MRWMLLVPCGEVPWQSKCTAENPNISSALPLVALVYLAVVLSCQQFREILYNIFGLITGWFLTGAFLNCISLHRKSHQKSVRIYLPAGTWNFWARGAKKDTCTNIHVCVAKRAMR